MDFGIMPQDCKLQNIEIGLNIAPPVRTKSILDKLIMHKREPFKWFSVAGHLKQSIHGGKRPNLIFKCYDKAKQYDIPTQLMRIELKYPRMERLNEKGLFNLADLLKPEVRDSLHNLLLQRWNEVLLPYNTGNKEYLSITYWQSLQTKYRNKYNREFKKVVQIEQDSGNDMRLNIANLLHQKWMFLNAPKNSQEVQIEHSNIRTIRTCLVTGIDITMQHKDSKYLSSKGIRYIYENDETTFLELYNKYLKGSRFQDASIKKQIKEMAVRIRVSNRKPKREAIKPVKEAILLPDEPRPERKNIGTQYLYLGDKLTDKGLINKLCYAVTRKDGKCIRGRGSMLVYFPGIGNTVVVGKKLRRTDKIKAK